MNISPELLNDIRSFLLNELRNCDDQNERADEIDELLVRINSFLDIP